jgi:hypothetical protein
MKSVTEISVTMNGEEFLDQLNDYELLKHSAPLNEVNFFCISNRLEMFSSYKELTPQHRRVK